MGRGETAVSEVAERRKTRRRSPRGNWLVVEMQDGKIRYCTWVRTWVGAQSSKRHKEKWLNQYAELRGVPQSRVGRVFILDIERMIAFSVTEGADEINDLYKLWEKS